MAYEAKFDYLISYEDRDDIHTSRWALVGVDTRAPGNTDLGWLWMSTVASGDSVAVTLYKDAAGSSSVMTGTVDKSSYPAKCALVEANSSGMSGEFYLEDWDADVTLSPVLVTLCTDTDCAELWQDIENLPSDIYSADYGLAKSCAAATRKVLLRVSQLYATELGGFGAPEERRFGSAARLKPDYRRIISPDQLKEAAALWALELALGSKHERSDETMYSELRDYFMEQREKVISAWSLTFDIDNDSDADTTKRTVTSFPTRL